MVSLKSWLVALAATCITSVLAQDGVPGDQTDGHNLTPDWFWHNRYFALLGMGSYGDFNETCPNQTFTREEQLKNFPNSTYPPWTLLETWDTPSGCKGFSAIVPEMNKVLLVFQGNWSLEVDLDPATTPWSSFLNDSSVCEGCTANSFAVQGYNEAKNATNFWEITRNAYYGAGLVFAITGHGLGGMHALVASVDFNHERICYYSHNHGTPRTFNPAGARWYNSNFNGEAGERAIWNNDQMGELFPASDDYAHAGTAFYYWGWDESEGQPNTYICWNDPDDGGCQPRDQGLDATIQEQHYFYFANAAQCGGDHEINTTAIQDLLGDDVDPEWSVPGFVNEPFVSTTYLPATLTYDDGSPAPTSTNDFLQTSTVVYYTTVPYDDDTTSEDTYTYAPPPTTRTTVDFTTTTRVTSRPTRTRTTRTTTRPATTTTRGSSGDGGGSEDGSGDGSDGSGNDRGDDSGSDS